MSTNIAMSMQLSSGPLGNLSVQEGIAKIQEIMSFRVASKPTEDILRKMRAIENHLNPIDQGQNWRRGVTGTNSNTNSIRRNTSTNSLNNNKWKSSTNSLTSYTVDSPRQEVNTPTTPASPPTPVSQKYESKFRNSEAAVEETILNTIILNKLNKFSASTYSEIRDFLYQILGSGETDFIKEFMRLVFKKAAAEEMFCPLYAKLLSELRATYPVIQTEMNLLFQSYLTIFKNVQSMTENDYKAFVARNAEKKYRLGYSQFLAELVILEAIDISTLQETFRILISNISTQGKEENQTTEIQEYGDCLLRMTKVFQKKNGIFFMNLRKELYSCIRPDLELILTNTKEYTSITAKSRFALMDVRDNLTKN